MLSAMRYALATLLYEPNPEKERTVTIHESSGSADLARIGSSACAAARRHTPLVLIFQRLSTSFLGLFLFLLDREWPPLIDAGRDNEDRDRDMKYPDAPMRVRPCAEN